MTQQDFDQKLDELDRLLNDPEVRLEPNRVWSLLAEVTRHDLGGEPRRPDPVAGIQRQHAEAMPRNESIAAQSSP